MSFEAYTREAVLRDCQASDADKAAVLALMGRTECMSTAEACKALGVSERTFWRNIKSGRLPLVPAETNDQNRKDRYWLTSDVVTAGSWLTRRGKKVTA